MVLEWRVQTARLQNLAGQHSMGKKAFTDDREPGGSKRGLPVRLVFSAGCQPSDFVFLLLQRQRLFSDALYMDSQKHALLRP